MKEIETGNVTRYCKPRDLQDGIVQSSAFEKREKDTFLSVHLLEFFQKETELENVLQIKAYMEAKNFNLKPNGCFAVVNIQQSKEYITEKESLEISYREENLPHCGIYYDTYDFVIAELLAQCVQNNYLIKDITDSKNDN